MARRTMIRRHVMQGEIFRAAALLDPEPRRETVLNALWAAPEVVGREGRVAPALPHDAVLELLAAHGRLAR